MLTQGWYSHFEHILNDCPEIGPSLPKTYKIFEANFGKIDFFQSFDKRTSNFTSNLYYQCSENSFELLHVSIAQKLTIPEFSPMIFPTLPSAISATS